MMTQINEVKFERQPSKNRKVKKNFETILKL